MEPPLAELGKIWVEEASWGKMKTSELDPQMNMLTWINLLLRERSRLEL